MTRPDVPHEQTLRLCGPYLLSALEPAAESAFERHLAGCPECQSECERLGPAASAVAGIDPTELSRLLKP